MWLRQHVAWQDWAVAGVLSAGALGCIMHDRGTPPIHVRLLEFSWGFQPSRIPRTLERLHSGARAGHTHLQWLRGCNLCSVSAATTLHPHRRCRGWSAEHASPLMPLLNHACYADGIMPCRCMGTTLPAWPSSPAHHQSRALTAHHLLKHPRLRYSATCTSVGLRRRYCESWRPHRPTWTPWQQLTGSQQIAQPLRSDSSAREVTFEVIGRRV